MRFNIVVIVLLIGLVFCCFEWLVDNCLLCYRFGQEVFAWQTTDVNYLAGSLAFFPFLGVLWITTIPAFRRKFFKVTSVCLLHQNSRCTDFEIPRTGRDFRIVAAVRSQTNTIL